jgi:hypothetical protein
MENENACGGVRCLHSDKRYMGNHISLLLVYKSEVTSSEKLKMVFLARHGGSCL